MDHPAPITVNDKLVIIDGTRFHLIYADLLPPLSESEYDALQADIEANGIRVPINVTQRADGSYDVTDGQHRLMIASELGLALDAVPLTVDDIDADTQETLALSLNLARRHLSTEQREQLVIHLRNKGKSLRAIGETLGISAATVTRVLDAAGVSFETPDTITGADGKQYPAMQEKTRTALDSEAILALFTDRATRISMDDIVKKTGLSWNSAIRALNLLEANKQLKRHSPGNVFMLASPDVPDERIRELLLEALGYQGNSLPIADVKAYINAHTPDAYTLGDITYDRIVKPLLATSEVMLVPVNRLGRGRWWYDEEEPEVEAYKTRIAEVLGKQDDGTATEHFLSRACGVRPRFSGGHYVTAREDLLEAGVIERVPGSGEARIRMATGQSDSAAGIDYPALLTTILREHGPSTMTELTRAVREATGTHFHGLHIVEARSTLLDAGTIVRLAGGQYALAENAPIVIVDGQPLSAKDIPGYDALQADAQRRAESTDATTEPPEDHEPGTPAATKSGPDAAAPQRRMVSIDTAREFVIDQLRKSQRPLMAGEISKWAGIELEVTRQALAAMVEAGNLVAVDDARGGQAYHYPDVIRAKTAKFIVDRARDLPMYVAISESHKELMNADYTLLTTEQIEQVRQHVSEAISGLGAQIEQLDALNQKLAAQLALSDDTVKETVSQ